MCPLLLYPLMLINFKLKKPLRVQMALLDLFVLIYSLIQKRAVRCIHGSNEASGVAFLKLVEGELCWNMS